MSDDVNWKDKYEKLVASLTQGAKSVLTHATVRPAMFIGGYRDNRDAEVLLLILMESMYLLMELKGKEEKDFQLKWGASPRKYHKNIDYDKTPQENLAKIKEMIDDFLRWIET